MSLKQHFRIVDMVDSNSNSQTQFPVVFMSLTLQSRKSLLNARLSKSKKSKKETNIKTLTNTYTKSDTQTTLNEIRDVDRPLSYD